MFRILTVAAAAALVLVASASAGIKRIDVSPMALVNLSEDKGISDESRLVGGAVAGDFYLTRNFAFRATIGYVRNLYNTSVSRIDQLFGDMEPMEDPNYSFRFSISPYAEANLGSGIRPYVTLNGSVSYAGGSSNRISNIASPTTGTISNSQYLPYNQNTLTYYEFSGSVGLKLPVAERLSLFGEVSHRFYSDYSTDWYYDAETIYQQVPFGFNEYKTLLSFGLTYSFTLSN